MDPGTDRNEVRLAGAGCVLRDWRADDLPGYAEWLRPHHAWHATNGPYLGRPTERDAAEATRRLATLTARPAADRPVPRPTLAVADPAAGTTVGFVSWYWQSQPTNWR